MQRYGLIGHPLKHSQSRHFFNAKFEYEGLDCVYQHFDLKSVDEIHEVMATYPDLCGFNVTIPYKEAIIPLLDEIDDMAKEVGAVNVVKIVDGKSYGGNTDGAGFVANVRRLGFDPEGKKATIVGSGGAASAITCQLAMDGAEEIDVFNRSDPYLSRAIIQSDVLSEMTGSRVTLYNLADRNRLAMSVAESDLIVNATPMGMTPNEEMCAFDESMLRPGLMVADTVYEPRETKLIRMAREKGLVTAPGTGMLLHQAALSEQFWFGDDVVMDIERIASEVFPKKW
jgi:shikimate dehydrogenase